mmetsp:Transcript_172087/g.551593  ORF Transcript_172087/g.551593 Transcript_172087/m.551593 type:complete len:244 (-) Transcript_172087:185-916(-)
MDASVDAVEARHRHDHLRRASELVEELVQRHAVSSRPGTTSSHRHAQNGVGPQLGLIRCAVEPDHQVVQALDVPGVLANDGRADDLHHILHRLLDTLAQVAGGITVPQLDGLVLAGGGARRHIRTEGPMGGGDLHLDGWVAAGVQDLARVHGLDHGCRRRRRSSKVELDRSVCAAHSRACVNTATKPTACELPRTKSTVLDSSSSSTSSSSSQGCLKGLKLKGAQRNMISKILYKKMLAPHGP